MNYWQLLTAAEQDLADGALRAAETGYHAALAARTGDGRRVFFTEQVPDGLGKLWRRLRGGEADQDQAGRWDARLAAFRRDFVAAAARVTDEARTNLDLGPGDQPRQAARVLEEALFLAVDTRLAPGQLAATRLLPALLELAPRVGRLPDLDLVPAVDDLPPDLRLELARLAVEHLEPLPSDQRLPWTRHLLHILDAEPPRPWSADDRARCTWLAAGLADRDLEDCHELVTRWTACDLPEQRPERCHWSRLRRAELLSGCDRRRPRRPDALAARRLAVGLPRDGGDDLAVRLQAALDTIDYRAPRSDLEQSWLSGAVASDGTVQLVAWWGDCPRDILSWAPDEDPAALRACLRSHGDRVIWAGRDLPADLAALWTGPAPGQGVVPLLEVLLEPSLPREGWSGDLAWGLALARSAAWRQDWRPDLGLRQLSPPGADGRLRDDQQDHAAALEAGLLWLGLRHRLDASDVALRAGLQELGRRGHATAAFVHGLAVLGAPDRATVDAGFEPWTLPLLWTRPDPLTGTDVETTGAAPRPELAGQDVAVITGGHPAAVLRAWGEGAQRWRVVMDQPGRQEHLAGLARESYGPVTVVPHRGRVHQLQAALGRLDQLIAHDTEHQDLLALCHWVRLVETHNGDLLDFQALRPRTAAACPVYHRYAELVADLPTEEPCADGDGWGAQYAQRVRRSGVVAGLVDDLPADAARLDPLWGVYDGSEASWVFLDSAAVHWRLGQGSPEAGLHRLLASRGRRHLSLLGGRGVLAADLRALYDTILSPYGRPYHGDLDDQRRPDLRLAGAMALPGAYLAPEAQLATVTAHLAGADHETVVLRPADPRDARYWSDLADGAQGQVGWQLVSVPTALTARRLVVPRLVSLDAPRVAAARGDHESDWAMADRERDQRRLQQRGRVALELAALQVSGVTLVEVLDARWWRWLLPEAASPEAALAQACAGGGAELLSSETPPTAPTTAVRQWLADGGCVAGLVPDWNGGSLAEARVLPLAGLHLHVGGGDNLWTDLCATMLTAWEQGQPVPRLLVVADTPPDGMAAVVAAVGAAGRSVIADGDDTTSLGPLVWSRPADLLSALGAGRDPGDLDAVLLLDLDRLLPGGAGQPLAGAGILGWLGRGKARRVDLVGGPLAPAWVTFLGHRLGGEVNAPRTGPGGWPRLRRGGIPDPEIHCPVCGHQGTAHVHGLSCAACGQDLSRVTAAADAVTAAAARARSLLAQTDLGRDQALEIWGTAEALAAVRREALAAGASPADSDLLCLTLADQRQWRLRPVTAGCRASSSQVVLLQPPVDPGRLEPLAPEAADAELQLLYDESDLRTLAEVTSLAATRRLLAVLGDETALASCAPGHDRPGRPTVSNWSLAWLAGLPETAVRRQLADLRWAARLGEDRVALSVAPVSGGGRLRLHVAQRDLESQLGGLSARMRAVVGAGHGTVPLGVVRAMDWADTSSLDRFLALAADPRWCGQLGIRPLLLHAAPRGAWFSRQRQVGRLVETSCLLEGLAALLDDMAAWCDQLLAETSRVETELEIALPLPLDPRPRAWLALGQELGFWSLGTTLGDDLVGLAEIEERLAPAVAADDAPCRQLLQELAWSSEQWWRCLSLTPAGGVLVTPDAGEVADEPRRWWRRGAADPLAEIRDEVTAWTGRSAPESLVLDGPPGTGKLEALLAGLARGDAGRRAEIWCPDAVTLARAQLEARRLDPTWSPELRLVAADQDPATVPGRAPAEVRPVVLLEVQRLERSVAYKLQDAGREAGVIMTVNPWEIPADASWEDLFVATPREAQTRRLRTQLAQARMPWEICRALKPEPDQVARPRRKERGRVEPRQAGTIDECAAAVTAARTAGHLGDEVLILAPHAEDVALLGRALADRQWQAVSVDGVAPLLAPGLLEAVAALADAHRQRHGQWPAGAGLLPSRGALLSALLPAATARTWPLWLRALPEAELDDAGAFLTRWQRSPWAPRGRLDAAAREQLRSWSASSSVTPAACLEPAAWGAWRRAMARALDRDDLKPPVPVALLATAQDPPPLQVESLVTVCFGNEPPTVHRQALSRVTDRALVLYQERSPLPGDTHEL